MINGEYKKLIERKRFRDVSCGFEIPKDKLNPKLSPFQSAIVPWALARGRAGLFEDTGLGKTFQGLEWAHQVCTHTKGRVLWLSPLCVARQTVEEADKFGIRSVEYARKMEDSLEDIVVTNYEMLEHFDVSKFVGAVLDESSILKSMDGKTKKRLIETFKNTPYRLSMSATPSPNDHMEIGNQAEFLGVMTATEMLSMFFIHDGGDTRKWRLKGHGVDRFWEWLATWCVVIKRPSDIGFSDEGYNLPKLNIIDHIVDSPTEAPDGLLFALPAKSLQETRKEQKNSIESRCKKVADLVNSSPHQWVVWCNLNPESDMLCKMIPDAKDIKGSYSVDEKENRVEGFRNGSIRVLVTKAKMGGYGSNWQHCFNMAHVGLSYSYQDFYQTIRRSWRYGQTNEVNIHLFRTANEGHVRDVLTQKQKQHEEMSIGMVSHMSEIMKRKIYQLERQEMEIVEDKKQGDGWELYLGDCVETMRKMENNSVHYSVFSPPFASLYTYSNSPYDMGNTSSHGEFYEQFKFAIYELLRITKPGRLLSFHCMNLPTTKCRDGVIGLSDFRGKLIQMFVESGWVYHSEVCIWKDPVTAMQRTKAKGLLWKQIQSDSAACRQGIPDYLVTMLKPGQNQEPIAHTKEQFPVDLWQRYASPVWFDIDQSDTLNRAEARENEDERHICPLQLGVIRRAMELWSNPGDIVFTPFAGIGSEIYVALKMGRRGIGVELKKKYFEVAIRNLTSATAQLSLL